VSRVLVAAVLAASVVAGCGGNDDASSSVGTDATTAEAPPGETRQLPIPDQQPGAPAKLTTQPARGEFQGIDFAEYDAALDDILFLLDDYWATTLPETFGAEYTSPADAIAYYPAEDDPGCGGEPLGDGNASYCPADNTIAWDEPGLMVPFYTEVGDAAVGFVLAHEWGHLVQQDLGLDFPLTIESELNADCLAGDFAGALFDEGLIEGGTGLKPGTDLAEAADGIFIVGDDPSVPWQDRQAHGTGQERLDAFSTGFDQGAQACVDQLGPGFSKTL
jgi:predicted metalloprotease